MIRLKNYFDMSNNNFLNSFAEENLKSDLMLEIDSIESFIKSIYKANDINYKEPNIEFSEDVDSQIIKKGKEIKHIHEDLVEFLDNNKNLDPMHPVEEKDLMRKLCEIEVLLNRVCGIDSDRPNNEEIIRKNENDLNELLKELEELLRRCGKIKKNNRKIDTKKVWGIYSDLKNREIKSILLGSYNYRSNTVTLYINAICNSQRAKTFSVSEVLMATYAHELFHAIHYFMMKDAGIRWKTSRNYNKDIVAESLAAFFEYLYIRCELENELFAESLVDEWRKFDRSYWPYSGAICMHRERDRDSVERISNKLDPIEVALFDMVLSDCLNDLDNAYHDICVFERLSNNQFGLFVGKK